MLEYYDRRAGEYEAVYRKPERQADLRQLEAWLPETLRGRDLLEIACGTGYWTLALSQTAQSITATDLSAEMLAIARTKPFACPVSFLQGDLYTAEIAGGTCTGLFGGFIWSHLPRERLAETLTRLTAALQPGGKAVFLDNRFVAGSSTPISQTDAVGNTYQLRPLTGGGVYEVLKNFPTRTEAEQAFPADGTVEWFETTYYWAVTFTRH